MKPTLEEIKDNYERVLLRLSNGELAGVVHDIRCVELQVVRKTNWKNPTKIYTIDLSDGYERNSHLGEYDIDAIAFMNDADEVDYYINNYDPKNIAWDWDINNPQCDDHMDAYEYAIQHLGLAKVPYNRYYIIKGDNNNMEEITQIYMDRKLKKINNKFENLIENRKLNDERYKTFKQCIDTLDKLYKEDNVLPLGHYTDINLSKQTLKDIELLEKIRCEEEERVAIKIYEARAQLKMCETYDQKQEILRRYNIINKNGKINA